MNFGHPSAVDSPNELMGRIYDNTWGRMFSALYDRAFEASEEAGLREMRAGLLKGARGRVLELGSGTGLNLELYPREGLDCLTLTEPDPHMFKQLKRRVEEIGCAADLVETGAEDLPFDDDSYDTVVVTLVLCTVPDQPAALREISRVLAGRSAALPGARPLEPPRPRQVAGPPGEALAVPRRRLPLQPRHRGRAEGRGVRAKRPRAPRTAKGPADCATDGKRHRQGRSIRFRCARNRG